MFLAAARFVTTLSDLFALRKGICLHVCNERFTHNEIFGLHQNCMSIFVNF